MDADPTTGMLIGETQNFSLSSRFGPAGVHYGEYRVGGTSLASPLIAYKREILVSRNFDPATRMTTCLQSSAGGRSSRKNRNFASGRALWTS